MQSYSVPNPLHTYNLKSSPYLKKPKPILPGRLRHQKYKSK